ncbi:MAG: hypothetical protein HY774_00410 [Acidobacteria bacterium]|nr:hypothetical protein [Acidobacteriota bacterium]
MPTLRIIFVIFIITALQTALPRYWPGFSYLDLPLILTVHLGLQRNASQAIWFGAIAGLCQDISLSSRLLGLCGFSKTAIGYSLWFFGNRFRLDGALLRIFILLASSAANTLMFVALHFFFAAAPEGMNIRGAMKIGGLQLVGNLLVSLLLFPIFDKFFHEDPYDPTRAPEVGRRKLN